MENSLLVAATKKSSSSSSSSLPTLPFDLIPEILSRLPVKSLLQFRCICKSWKHLISDSNFAKKHLTLSTTHTLHCTSYSRNEHFLLKSYSLDSSVLTNITQTQFPSFNTSVFFVGSCDGILCLVIDGEDLQGVDFFIIQLWNPSIRKFKELPSINLPQDYHGFIYGFGYDLISHNYKVVVGFSNYTCEEFSDDFSDNEVKVHTLGTDSWRSVSKFPFNIVSAQRSGQHVSGTLNWSVSTGIKRFIASFDLGNECFQEVLLPGDDSGQIDKKAINLSVFRDCLCIIFGEDVWVMKEYGNKKSWTKLFTIPCMPEPWASSYPSIKAIRVFEDEQVLLLAYREAKRWGNRWNYISYNRKNDTSKLIEFNVDIPNFCIESLISPCF